MQEGMFRRASAIAARGIVVATVVLAVRVATAAEAVCGDVNDSGTVTSADALDVLKVAVLLPVQLQCAAPATLLETGQTTCYDATGKPIDCAGTGQDGDLHMGVARRFTDNGETITDDKTGLMWEKLSDDGSIHDKDTTYTWADAFAVKVATLNSMNFADHDDWRVPNQFESYSLVNFGAVNPAMYSVFHGECGSGCTVLQCSCTELSFYWSSSTCQDDTKLAWVVYALNGGAVVEYKTNYGSVRAVRSGS